MISLPERILKNYDLLEETGMNHGCAIMQYFEAAFAQSLCQPSLSVLELLSHRCLSLHPIIGFGAVHCYRLS